MSSPVPSGGPGYYDNLGPQLNIVAWIFTSLALVSVVLRLYTRVRISHAAGWDDAVITWALVISITSAGLYSACVTAGLGRHIETIPKTKVTFAAKLIVVTASIIVHNFSWPKLAIVILLDRLLIPNRWMRVILYFLVSSLICSSFVLTILWFKQCDPVPKDWNKMLPGTCLNPAVLTDFSYFVGSYSAFQDFLLALYPIIVIYGLQMPRQKKLALSIVFSLGLLAGAVAIYKCTLLKNLSQTQDLTYYTTAVYMWTCIESQLIIIIACLPTLSPLIRLLTGKVASTMGSYANRTATSTNKHSHSNSQSGSHGIFKKGDNSNKRGNDLSQLQADDVKLLDLVAGVAKPGAAGSNADTSLQSNANGHTQSTNGNPSTNQTASKGSPARARSPYGGRDSDEDLGVEVTKTVDVSIEPDLGRGEAVPHMDARHEQPPPPGSSRRQGNDRELVRDLENGWH